MEHKAWIKEPWKIEDFKWSLVEWKDLSTKNPRPTFKMINVHQRLDSPWPIGYTTRCKDVDHGRVYVGKMLASNATMSIIELLHLTSYRDECMFFKDHSIDEYPPEGMASKNLVHEVMMNTSKSWKRWGVGPRERFPMPNGFELLDPKHGTVASLKSG